MRLAESCESETSNEQGEDVTEGWRTPQQREMDSILYSSAWRRLRGVTQVLPITGGVSKTHDRLTHSLKVAQVGMRFAQYLRFTDEASSTMIIPEAVHVAGMAHDLGHPPFGHIAENELQRILTDQNYTWRLTDSFEGNAQTFRILTRLAKKRKEPPEGGLGLSVESLAACTKYPWAHGKARDVIGESAYAKNPSYFDKKWGYYDSDQEAWQRVLDTGLYEDTRYSPNAKLMDIADDVTFAVHDILDYFRRHLIPLHEIGAGLKKRGDERQKVAEFERFDDYAWNSLTIAKDLNTTVQNKNAAKVWLSQLNYPGAKYSDTDEDRRALHDFETEAVSAVQRSLKITQGLPQIPDEVRLALEYLKELTWFYVINHPHLSASQMGQRRIIRELHEWICLWVVSAQSNEGDYKEEKNERDSRRLPGRLQSLMLSSKDSENTEEARISRSVVDFISSLTDAEAVSLHHQLGGSNSAIEEVSWL